jgi:hypothetical protein
MSNPFDKDELGNKAVLEFSSIKKKKIDTTNAKSDKKVEPVSFKGTLDTPDKADMKIKLDSARLHANKEIATYRDLVSNFKKEVEKLTLFENVGEAVESICVDYILEEVIDPILKGNKPYGMPEDLFREIRRDMYKNLMYKYTEK